MGAMGAVAPITIYLQGPSPLTKCQGLEYDSDMKLGSRSFTLVPLKLAGF